MKQEIISNNRILLVTVGVIFFIIGIGVGYTVYITSNDNLSHIEKLNYENGLMKSIMYADASFNELIRISTLSETYYSEATYAYELQNYKGVQTNCATARIYYSQEEQELRNIKAKLLSSGYENDELIQLYVELLDYGIKIKTNLYEACEHFESASRYYDYYYLTTTPADDMSYTMGGQEIDMSNKKIDEHDRNVNLYNDKLAEYNTELKRRFGI